MTQHDEISKVVREVRASQDADGWPPIIRKWADQLESAPAPPPSGPTINAAEIDSRLIGECADAIAWESTSFGYKRYITDDTYQKLKPSFQRWYKPYRCTSCAAQPAAADDMTSCGHSKYDPCHNCGG